MKTISSGDSEASSVMYEFTQIHTNPPYFDFKNAELSFGIQYESISQDGFKEFLNEKFLEILPNIRKSLQNRDWKLLDEYSHKIKGAFS